MLISVLLSLSITAGCARTPGMTAGRLVADILGAPDSANQVWPGYSVPDRDLLFYDKTGAYIVTKKPRPASFVPVPDSIKLPRHRERVYWRAGRFPGLDGSIDSRYEIDGMIVNAVPVGDSPHTFAYHELFHAFQSASFVDTSYTVEQIEARFTPEYAADTEVERRILGEALVVGGTARDSLVQLFLAIRADRLRGVSAPMVSAERRYERHEGLADFVSYWTMALAGRGVEWAIDKVRVMLRTPLTRYSIGTGGASERLIRMRAYSTGSAMAILLEQTGKDWKPQAQRGVALDLLLAEAVAFDTSTIASLASRAREKFDHRGLIGMKEPPWGKIADMTEEEFSRLGAFSVVMDSPIGPGMSFAPGPLGMHRPAPEVVLFPGMTSARELAPGLYELSLEDHSMKVDTRRADGTRILATFLFKKRPTIAPDTLVSGRSYNLPSLAVTDDKFSLTIMAPVNVTVASTSVTIVLR